MLKHADEMQESTRPDIRQLLERLTADGRGWAEAEFALARTELNALKAQAIRAASFAVIGIASVFCALAAFSQAGIAFLTPHVDSAGVAALIVGSVFLVLVAGSALLIRNALSWRTQSVFFRWFGGRSSGGPGS